MNKIEIFLFVDPLGKKCNHVRKTVKDFYYDQADKVKLRIIPVVNFRKVYGRTRKNHNSTNHSLVELNNHYSTNTYKASLAFHASSMQGKKKAHQFLKQLQEKVVDQDINFSESLVMQIAEDVNLDLEAFKEDYQSPLAKKAYEKNLRLASEMKIDRTPSCVIYKNNDKEKAIRVDEAIERVVLESVCECKPRQSEEQPLIVKREIQQVVQNLNIL